MKETFGQRLARLRKEKGYTQEDVASKITISPQAVSIWRLSILYHTENHGIHHNNTVVYHRSPR